MRIIDFNARRIQELSTIIMLSDTRLLARLEKSRKKLTDNYVFCKIEYGTTPEEVTENNRQRVLRDQAIRKYYKRFEILRSEVIKRRMAMITPLMRKVTLEANLQEAERKLAEMEYKRVGYAPAIPDTREYRHKPIKQAEFTQKQLKLFDRQITNMGKFISTKGK